MKKKVKKLLACCLILAMCLCNLPVTTITSQAAAKKSNINQIKRSIKKPDGRAGIPTESKKGKTIKGK